MQDFFDNAHPRVVAMSLIAIVLMVLAIEITYVLWPQLNNYRNLNASHDVLEQAISNSDSLSSQLDGIEADVHKLSRQLHGDMAQLPEKEMESFVIGRLQKVSWATDVELVSVQPGNGKQVQNLRESLYEVKLAAGYHDFFEWLQIVNHELGYIVIEKFDISSNDRNALKNPKLSLLLTLVSYRMEKNAAQ